MNERTYKIIDLFGNEELKIVENKAAPVANLFDDYDGFLEKFEVKKTTDDCFTPPEVFKIVLDYVNKNCNIKGIKIIRPFFPGGDYENIDYPDNCVVIDNPPFSIISKICRFYIERGISFFLFAPHLTLFSSDIDVSHIVADATIKYANGATVKTSFLSNMFGDAKIIGDADLCSKFKELNQKNKVNNPKYKYPKNIATVSGIAWIISRGVSIKLDKKHVKHYRGLDSQKKHGKAIFGSGFLLSKQAAAEQAAAEQAAAEQAKESFIIEWEISKKENEIIKSLGNNFKT